MNNTDIQKLIVVLEEVRDIQRIQLEHQAEALKLQREQVAILQKNMERTERIQARAEAIQEKSAQLVTGSKKILSVVLPIILVLVIYMSWLLFSGR